MKKLLYKPIIDTSNTIEFLDLFIPGLLTLMAVFAIATLLQQLGRYQRLHVLHLLQQRMLP